MKTLRTWRLLRAAERSPLLRAHHPTPEQMVERLHAVLDDEQL